MKQTKTAVIKPTDLTASDPRMIVIGAFNPGAIGDGNTIHLLVRVAEQPRPQAGMVGLPRCTPNGEMQIDCFSEQDVRAIDARVVLVGNPPKARLTGVSHLRAGTAPIRTQGGWWTMYHASEHPIERVDVGRYQGFGLLLDLKDPTRIVKHSGQPALVPTEEFETDGFVPNIVFPTAAVDVDEGNAVFYGAADAVTAVARFDHLPES